MEWGATSPRPLPSPARCWPSAELDPEHRVQLIGRESCCASNSGPSRRGACGACASRIDFIDAADVIDMADKPTAALRGKPNSSMHVGLKLQVEGKSDAFVSAGNTGAQMAVSTVILRLHPEVPRAAIATVFPTAREPIVVVDSGANVDCSAAELVQFARLGAAYAESVFGEPTPASGCSASARSRRRERGREGGAPVAGASGLNFQGNIEGATCRKGIGSRAVRRRRLRRLRRQHRAQVL